MRVSRKRRASSSRLPNNWDSGTISSTIPSWVGYSPDQLLNCCTKYEKVINLTAMHVLF